MREKNNNKATQQRETEPSQTTTYTARVRVRVGMSRRKMPFMWGAKFNSIRQSNKQRILFHFQIFNLQRGKSPSIYF